MDAGPMDGMHSKKGGEKKDRKGRVRRRTLRTDGTVDFYKKGGNKNETD